MRIKILRKLKDVEIYRKLFNRQMKYVEQKTEMNNLLYKERDERKR